MIRTYHPPVTTYKLASESECRLMLFEQKQALVVGSMCGSQRFQIWPRAPTCGRQPTSNAIADCDYAAHRLYLRQKLGMSVAIASWWGFRVKSLGHPMLYSWLACRM